MLVVAGTVPIEDLPLTVGRPRLKNGFLIIDDIEIPCTMGTAAMISTAIVTCKYLSMDTPLWITAGDLGDGSGSRDIYEYLTVAACNTISPTSPYVKLDILAMHYMMPIMGLMRNVVDSFEASGNKPILIADAGSMYAAKSAGLATKFDVFTPDAGEMAFLADPQATHPAYIQHYIFGIDAVSSEIPRLIEQAYKNGNAAKVLIVKNPVDHIALEGRIIATVSEPNIPVLESIGGTGDTITGLVSAFLAAGFDLDKAAIAAAKANRMAGKYANPTTATKIWEIISQFPQVFKKHLCEWSGVCAVY